MFTGLYFYNYGSNTKWASEVRWEEWSGEALEWDSITLGFFLPGLDCWGQMKAANDSMVAGSRSAALASSSSSTLSSLFFFPPSAQLSVKNMFPVVSWELWNDGFLSERGGANEEGLVLSNCVYSSNTIISSCDSLIEWLHSEREWPWCPLALLHCRVCSLVLLLLWTVSSKILRHFTKSQKTFNSCGILSHLLLFWCLIGGYFSEERLKLEGN